jgi:hypothetical protein
MGGPSRCTFGKRASNLLAHEVGIYGPWEWGSSRKRSTSIRNTLSDVDLSGITEPVARSAAWRTKLLTYRKPGTIASDHVCLRDTAPGPEAPSG